MARLTEKHGHPATGETDPATYQSFGQDPVAQLLVGFGWRVTGQHTGAGSRSMVVQSPDTNGVKFVFTCHNSLTISDLQGAEVTSGEETYKHFDATNIQVFSKSHAGRQGVGVLAFEVAKGDIDAIQASYTEKHPKLLVPGSPVSYDGDARVLEVYAYYKGEKSVSDADPGTILRFIEPPTGAERSWVLPGIEAVPAVFDGLAQPVYCDHWVSNVHSRTGFLETLEETLGFTSKVNFNAGVVAAGEAQIESTVTGNNTATIFEDIGAALVDQSQIYLPTNNALSEVGHVSIFLREIGQGIQHIASRVENLVDHIQRANEFRQMTGTGVSFLMIPRSYYGSLDAKRFARDAGLEQSQAEQCVSAFRQAGFVDSRSIVDLDVTREQVVSALPAGVPESAVEHVLRARYGNMYNMLRDYFTERDYLNIVRNNILVDIQGEDVLLQIFTAKVLQKGAGEEAPFWEFIQRVCKDKGGKAQVRPGCGGFGIRNFLTLFLSIEVSKAASQRAEAEAQGDTKAAEYAQKMVDAFTSQLEESNPILTGISDAMTAEGLALEAGDTEGAAKWTAAKSEGNQKLMEVSAKYNAIMKKLREEAAA